MTFLLVALGGALGSVARFAIQRIVGQSLGTAFPYGTLLVNISGSIVMGLFIGFIARENVPHAQNWRLFFAIGVLGGYTTFSSFSLDSVTLLEEGKWFAMSIYVLASVIGSFAGLFLGLRAMRLFA